MLCRRLFTKRVRVYGLIGLLLMLVIAESGCGRKGKRRKGSGGGGASFDPDQEQEIDTGKVKEIDTGDTEVTTRLVFKTSGDQSEGRYLSEYLMVVRAAEESYVRLKMGPTDGLADGADIDKATGNSGHSSPNPGLRLSAAAHNNEVTVGNAGVTNSRPQSYSQGHLAALNFLTGPRRAQNLVAPSLCSLRLFRMKGTGMNPTVSKTGRLVYATADGQSHRVRVWLDEEVGNMCRGGTQPTHLGRYRFTHLTQSSKDFYDQFRTEFVAAIHDQTRQALQLLSDTYGAISDVDGSGALDVFISPDVNRHYMMPFDYGGAIDRIQPYPIHRPEDLAAYDPVKNPTSNEGEVVYLWAPDPAGLWGKGRYPSTNTLSSNFAKGFTGAQIMSLIISNYRLLKRRGQPEEQWLIDALSLLGASYVGGNDLPFDFLTNYLSSRPQSVSLTSGSAEAFGLQEVLGMRTLFAWYLHARYCGTTVTPCAKLKDVMDSDKTGAENIAALTGEDFKKTLQNFGISVGTHLTDDPAVVRALWNDPPEDIPSKPIEMSSLTEVNSDSPTKVRVLNNLATAVSGALNDPTVAGPFPSYDMLLFQPLLPDNELDIKLAKDSVTPILVTGLVAERTDVTAALGKQLNVTFIPLGNRNTNLRQIHQEKLSEFGHVDQRSVNLTTKTSGQLAVPAFTDADFLAMVNMNPYVYPTATYAEAPEYTDDMSVNESRELWIFGSIDNFKIKEGTSERVIGDVDAYSVEIKPCAVSGCSTSQEVIVQLYSRDFEKQLKPMFLATTTDRGKFRGHALKGMLKDFDSEMANKMAEVHDDSDEVYRAVLCEHDGTDFTVCPQPRLNHDLFADGKFAMTFDNFLHSGPLGFPRLNNMTMTYEGAAEREPAYAFDPEESNRQFFNFAFIANNKLNNFEYFSIPPGLPYGPSFKVLTADEIRALFNVQSYLGSLSGSDPDPEDIPAYFMDDCTSLGIFDEYCNAPWTNLALINTGVEQYLNDGLSIKRAVCYHIQGACPMYAAMQDLVIGNANAGPYLFEAIPANFSKPLLINVGKTNESRKTWYVPAVLTASGGVCGGSSVVPAPQVHQTCGVSSESLMAAGDIRHQLDMSLNEMSFACTGGSCPLEFKSPIQVLLDVISFKVETAPSMAPIYVTREDFISGHLRRETIGAGYRSLEDLESRKGEVLAKEELIHIARFKVPAAGTTMQFLVGGRKQSQGKYLLRVRVKQYN